MKEFSIGPTQHAFVADGILKIEHIAVGVGVILYAPARKQAAGVHILSAHSTLEAPTYPGQFANVAIPALLRQLEQNGVAPPYCAAIAGGARMEGFPPDSRFGEKLVAAVKEELTKASVDLKVEQTGGSKMRVMEFDSRSGEVQVAFEDI
ncbi:MAG: chemotaxis protein CheD [Kiritimatiellae bacterium]|nr:chemotaxis protein CheD [Kiritimatiellia bacterium]